MKRPSKHRLAQIAGRKRDNGICQACGTTRNPQGHHIFDFQFSGAAHVDNIITLCKECHKKVHQGILDVFKF